MHFKAAHAVQLGQRHGVFPAFVAHLDAVDVQDALLLGHKFEVDEVCKGPKGIVA